VTEKGGARPTPATLPKLGCDVCNDQGMQLIGFVLVMKPGSGRVVEKCQCRVRREQAKRAMEAKA
jgi:hypothetical protein